MRYTRGTTTLFVLGFMSISMLIIGTVSSYAFQQSKYGRAQYAREQAFHIAESGIEYYRWWLTRNPSVMVSGAGLTSPYSYTVNDPEAGELGSASVTATASKQCNAVQWVDLSSTGTANSGVGFPRTVAARYMKRTVAEYAFLYNSTVWFGATNVGVGPYHANSGMRMDGTSNSVISASVAQVYCNSSTLGCNGVSPNPSAGWKSGVFGLSTNTLLWQTSVTPIDFTGMVLNFSTLRTYAQTSGIMLNPTSVTRAGVQQGSSFSTVGGVDNKGFHIVFNANGTINIYAVTATNSEGSGTPVYSYNSIYPSSGWKYTYPVIVSETLVASNVSLPSDCAIIFSEAKTWIDGTVSGKFTLIAADTGSFVPDIILNNNITYATTDGTTGLTAVAEGSIKLGLVVPDTLSLRGIFVATTGNYSRDYYVAGSGYLPSSYNTYVVRNQLNVAGTMVSNQGGGVCYSSGGSCLSGFNNRNHTYDRVLAFSPPPFTPAVSSTYSLVLWREQ